jgi:hypothetical protein
MERRRLIKSLCALLGAGAPATAAAESKPSISKNSTRCEVSERARAETTDSAEGPSALRRGSSSESIQK